MPDPVQKKPVKVNIGANLKVVAAQIDEESIIHLLMRHSGLNKIQYGKFDIGKGEMISGITSLPTTPASFELPEAGPISPAQIDHTFGDCPVILLDAQKVHHPLFFTDGVLQAGCFMFSRS